MVKHYKEILSAFLLLLLAITTAGIITRSYEVNVEIPEKSDFVVTAETSPENNVSEILLFSPDEKKSLKLINTGSGDGTVEQTLKIGDVKEGVEINLLQIKSSASRELYVPYNTFAPTNKYIFLSEKNSEPEYLVYRTDGEDISADKKYLEVRALFKEKFEDLVIDDITGWAGYTLLMVNTNFRDGKIGPSLWFDVTSQRFIRLNTRFN